MRLLRRPLIRTQVEIAGRNKPVMAQDVFNMPDGTAVEEKHRCHSVAQHVRENDPSTASARASAHSSEVRM